MNIAGFDFGCNTDGACTASGAWPPLTEYYGHDGAGQMQHFVNNDGFNVFRLPVGWQFLTNDVLTGTLDEDNFQEYDTLVQTCLATGASCIVDVHNYARWNKEVSESKHCLIHVLKAVIDHRPGWPEQRDLRRAVEQYRCQVRR